MLVCSFLYWGEFQLLMSSLALICALTDAFYMFGNSEFKGIVACHFYMYLLAITVPY